MNLASRRDARLPEEPRLPDRRHHAGRARHGLVRRGAADDRFLPALDVPDERVIDTNGAGDIFHGAYVYSAIARPQRRAGSEHFRLRPRGLGLRGPAPRQRGEPADAVRHRRDAGPLPARRSRNRASPRRGERRIAPWPAGSASARPAGPSRARSRRRFSRRRRASRPLQPALQRDRDQFELPPPPPPRDLRTVGRMRAEGVPVLAQGAAGDHA